MVWLIIGAIIVLAFLLALRARASGTKPQQSKATNITTARKGFTRPSDPDNTYYSAEEVKSHNKKDDLWIIVKGKVYDVTSYVEEHVGGDAILRNPGLDNTEGFFGDQHPEKAHDMLPEFYIGQLQSKKNS